MRFSVRPYLMAGVGMVAAGSIAIPSSVAPLSPASRHDSVTLSANVQPLNPLLKQPGFATTAAAAALLPAEALTSTEAMTATLDTASAQVSALALPGLESAIINAYDVIMPWVDWGVNLGIYATQWIPVVNWFTPQISIFYYSLIRPIITSAVFNIAYFVGGTVSFGQGLTNFFNDTVNAGIGFVNAEIDWLLSFLPPFPPFPPFFSSLAAQSTMEVMGARTAVQVPAAVGSPLTDGDEDAPESPVEPVDETETDAETEPETTPAEPAAEQTVPQTGAPAETPIETEVEDVEPQEPVETQDPVVDPKDEDEEDKKDDSVEDKTGLDADEDADTTAPGAVQNDPPSDPTSGSEPDDKPDTEPDNKPSATSNSGSG